MNERVLLLEKELRKLIDAIEGGQMLNDSRGVVYTQQFGIAYVKHLKGVLNLKSASGSGE